MLRACGWAMHVRPQTPARPEANQGTSGRSCALPGQPWQLLLGQARPLGWHCHLLESAQAPGAST